MKRHVGAMWLLTVLVAAACETRSPLGPSPTSGAQRGDATSIESRLPAIARIQFTEWNADSAKVEIDLENGEYGQFDLAATPAQSAEDAAAVVLCELDELCYGQGDQIGRQAWPIIAATVALGLAVDGAWTFWNTCANVAQRENARTGTVSWSTVGDCYYQASMILAGGRLGKALESIGSSGVRSKIERALKSAVSQGDLHSLFNSKNFKTTASIVSDIIVRFVDRAITGLYNLLRN